MTRIDKILTHAMFIDYLGLIAAKEVTRKFCCHDMQHLIDTARITYILVLEAETSTKEFTKDIIYAAALLHDIGRWQEYETGEDHAEVSCRLAEPILIEVGFSSEEINIICTGILEHRKLPQKPSLLGRLLYKADKLSRLCHSCVARCDCYKFMKTDKQKHLLTY